MTDDWRARRDLAVTRHAEAAAKARAAEAAEARALIADFVARAGDLTPVRLKARPYSGGGRYRTNVTGWYIHPDESMAIGVDGGFYLLTVVPSITARLRGATVEPQEPLLIIGRGAKDGESISLKELLRRRLEAGDDWPRP
ncbi:MAG: hypothetical protein HOV83_39035 [Catenulispora sp.]|nr:hypothetical protein [Catenulispora sp.]